MVESYQDVVSIWTIGYGSIRIWGRPVRKGDVITQQEAENLLDIELTSLESQLRAALTAPVTQSMFDALVSFAFNLGMNGAAKQIERVNARKFEECALKFREYNKADGKVFEGLVRRRADEEALFRKDGFPGGTQVSKATWIEIHGGSKAETIVAYDGDTPVEILSTERVGALIYFLQKHDEALTFQVARDDKPVPVISAPKPDTSVAVLTATGGTYATDAWAGLKRLTLSVEGETFAVCSGSRVSQILRRPQDPRSVPGNLEPIPQGEYEIGDIQWASGTDNYEGSFGPGLGPVWVPLTAKFSDDRGAFGFHVDHNRDGAPGSAGCVVFYDIPQLKAFIAALRKHDPKTLKVDWNLS